ncbi:MAG TPA: PASTA domain-containing protein [Candidatus Cloacimonetes bacterium]|nr:PASTA domain-containing protein [Candidatus Cloacimonadota bacterium]
MKKINPYLIALSILLIAFIIGFFAVNMFMKLVVGHGNEVKVPNIVAMDFEVARKNCKDLKLYVQQSESIHNNDLEKGRIISQEPHHGIMTKKFRTIKVVVSKGPEMVRIPYLDNLGVMEAKMKLENAGLFLGKKIFRYSDYVKKDKVIFSQPMADELIARKSKIDVIISLGKLPEVSPKHDKYKNLLDDAGK